jgi:hypothetical protein
MTISCTRCGASQDGDVILPIIAFKFKHNKGCGHGVGPLARMPSNKTKHTESHVEKILKEIEKSDVKVSDVRISPKGKPIDELPKKSKSKIEKLKVFGKKD